MTHATEAAHQRVAPRSRHQQRAWELFEVRTSRVADVTTRTRRAQTGSRSVSRETHGADSAGTPDGGSHASAACTDFPPLTARLGAQAKLRGTIP